MENVELKEIIEELYKFLREKIITNYGQYLSEDDKKLLYSYDVVKNIVIDNNQNNPVKYNIDNNKIVVSNNFLNDVYIDKLKLKVNTSLVELKEKINNNSMNITKEELIIHSKDLGIQQRDIIKSLLIQEILKMILITDEENIKESIIREGVIEILAHEVGNELGFIVSTPVKMLNNLHVAELLKAELGSDFKKLIGGNVDKYLSKITNEKLLNEIENLTNDREVLESTQNLDEITNAINGITENLSQISIVEDGGKHLIKFVDELGNPTLYETRNKRQFMNIYNELVEGKKSGEERVTKEELLKSLDTFSSEIPLYKEYEVKPKDDELSEYNIIKQETKYDKGKLFVNSEEGIYVKEAIVKIDTNESDIEMEKHSDVSLEKSIDNSLKKAEEKKTEVRQIEELTKEEFNELYQRFVKNECTYEEMIMMQKYVDEKQENQITNETPVRTLNKKGKVTIVTILIVILLTIAVGIAIGWLLFNLK